MLFSCASSLVTSGGNPYVSYNLNTTFPSILFFPCSLALFISFSNSFSPCANVFTNLFFSSIITFFINSAFLAKSGYISFKFSTFISTRVDISSRLICSLFICLTILRINLLKIYPLSTLLGLPPSLIIIMLERKCSAIILLLSMLSIFCNSNNLSITGLNNSVSNGVSFPCNSIAILSSPNPVSTFLCANFEYFPSLLLKYSINTLFHISTYLPQSQLGWQSGPHAGFPVS